MKKGIPDREKELLKILRETSKIPASKMHGAWDRYRFSRFIRSRLPRNRANRPWLFLACVWFYRLCLYWHEIKSSKEKSNSDVLLSRRLERMEGLRFAVQYGRYATEDERSWAFHTIERLGINCFDAPVLVWSRTLHLRERAIYFGHWNWISGIVQLTPVYILAVTCISLALCCNLEPFEKSFQISITLAMMLFLYKFTEAQSFNVYRIGSKYFHSHGFGIKPIHN